MTVLVRTPQQLTTQHERLRVLTGSVTDGGRVADAVRGQEAVISALGVGNSLKSAGLIARSMPVIIHAMETQGAAA